MANVSNKRRVTVTFETTASMTHALELQAAVNEYIQAARKPATVSAAAHERLQIAIRNSDAMVAEVSTK